MALWTDLTPEEQDIVATYSRETRGNAINHQRVVNEINNLLNQWNANVSFIVATLDPTERIPDNNGLAGAETMTANDLTNLTSTIQNHNTDLTAAASVTPNEGYDAAVYSQQRSKAGGPTNMV